MIPVIYIYFNSSNLHIVGILNILSINLDHLGQYHDCEMLEEIIINICDMYMNKTTHIKGQDMPQSVVRGVIGKA